MNAEIDDLLTAAAAAVHAAQTALRKSATPRKIDILRKLDDPQPRASEDNPAARALANLADAERRLDHLEAQRDLDAQAPRKTWAQS
jgi:hypothetical protein